VEAVPVDADELHARIAAQIRQRVAARGMTLRAFAEEMGTGPTHLWAILGGRRSPTMTWLCRAATVLECEPIVLLRPLRKR